VFALFVLKNLKPIFYPGPKFTQDRQTPRPIKNCFVKLICSLTNKAEMICPAEIVFWKNVPVTRHNERLGDGAGGELTF
jgi:hypothetical protein